MINLKSQAELVFANYIVEDNDDDLSDCAYEAADRAVIYTRDALEIISRYESEAGILEDFPKTYKASEWCEAATSYAHSIAVEILSRELQSLYLDYIEARDLILEYSDTPGVWISAITQV